MTLRSAPVDDFSLAYDRVGSGPPVVLLHGWPGDRTDYRSVVPLLAGRADVIVPDFRGFGESDKHDLPPLEAYTRDRQAASVLALIDELELERPVVAGYDIGSRVAQVIAGSRPEVLRSLVLVPPLPGAGERVFEPEILAEFWYQHFHNLELAETLIDGQPDQVRRYLSHFWAHWSGPKYGLPDTDLDHLVDVYSQPGAFTASIAWYRARSGTLSRAREERAPAPDDRIGVRTTALWPDHDPLFPQAWADVLGDWFSDVDVRLLSGVGHFVPLEAPQPFADAILEQL
ncbi:MAG TPA: alpha/beta hydrolase [Thermoleophilaceae bacterium]|nr:alpha/beta hydrolase [Thermoleophilaceae bacterium]